MRFEVPEDEIPFFSEEEAFPLGRAKEVLFQAKIALPPGAQKIRPHENHYILTSKTMLREAVWRFLERELPPVPNPKFPTCPQEYWFHGASWAKPGPPVKDQKKGTPRNLQKHPYEHAIIGYRAHICEKGLAKLDAHLTEEGILNLEWAEGATQLEVIFPDRVVKRTYNIEGFPFGTPPELVQEYLEALQLNPARVDKPRISEEYTATLVLEKPLANEAKFKVGKTHLKFTRKAAISGAQRPKHPPTQDGKPKKPSYADMAKQGTSHQSPVTCNMEQPVRSPPPSEVESQEPQEPEPKRKALTKRPQAVLQNPRHLPDQSSLMPGQQETFPEQEPSSAQKPPAEQPTAQEHGPNHNADITDQATTHRETSVSLIITDDVEMETEQPDTDPDSGVPHSA
jgi:hypothetical protein